MIVEAIEPVGYRTGESGLSFGFVSDRREVSDFDKVSYLSLGCQKQL